MMIQEIVDAVRGLFAEIAAAKLPHELVVNYPEGSPAHGTEAGRWHLRRSSDGGFRYEYTETPRGPVRLSAMSDFVVGHSFEALSSLAAYLKSWPDAAVFITGDAFQAKTIRTLIEQLYPEQGQVALVCQRHPTWLRWAKIAGNGDLRDLDHVTLADLLLDNQEDLEEPMLAKVLATFRAAKSIEHVADHDTGSAMGVRVQWKGTAGSEGPKATDVKVPREFAAQIPAFVGAWEAGAEPRHTAKFRLRVIPPRGEEAGPRFRILWVNAREYEITASAAIEASVRAAVGGTLPVYLGSPNAQRYVPLKEGAAP